MGDMMIEPGIAPVVRALNEASGIQTLWSCHGHARRPANAYVTFRAPEEIAFALHRALERNDELLYCWKMTASFQEDGVMQYTIAPNDVRLPEHRRRWLTVGWRRRMDRELVALAHLVERVTH